MAQEKKFIKEALRKTEIEKYFSKEFSKAGYSHSEIQRTPLAMRITLHAQKPGMIIGRGGKNIDRLTQLLKEKFGFENPQLDVQEVRDPYLDAKIVASQIVAAIERGLQHKKIINIMIQKIMESGATGVAIRISGKVGGEMGRTEKYSSGYLKFSGDPAESLVDKAYAQAIVKLGMIGVQVRIMRERPKEMEALRRLREPLEEEKVEEIKIEESVEEDSVEEIKIEESVEEDQKEEVNADVNIEEERIEKNE